MRRGRHGPATLAVAAALLGGGCGYVGVGVLLWPPDESGGDAPAPAPPPSNAVPSANVSTPTGNQANAVPISYLLIDAEGNPADISVSYSFSTDGGVTWSVFTACTEAPGPPSEGTAGLPASPSGTPHTFVWSSFADAGGANGLARIRIAPSDPGPPPRPGTPGETTVSGFPLLNRLIATVVGAGTGLLNFPGAVARDASGNLYVADTFNHRVRVLNTQASAITVAGVTIPSNQLAVVAGTGIAGWNGDNQIATAAELNFPSGLALDPGGHLVLADSLNHRIRRVDRTTGFITTLAGTGVPGTSGDGGLATQAQLAAPRGVAFDGNGNLLVADTGSQVVRVVNNQSTAITVAGVTVQPNTMRAFAGQPGSAGSGGDGGAATSASLDTPWSLAVTAGGAVLAADSGNHAVRAVNPGTTSTTVAGVTIAGGNIATVAGTNGTAGLSGDGGAATSALLSDPRGLALDGNGNLAVADTGNDRVRIVNTQSSSIVVAGVTIGSNQIGTVAGGGASPGPNDGDGGAATSARLSQPEGLVALAGGHWGVADTGLGRIRVVNAGTTGISVAGVSIAGGAIQTVAGTVAAVAPLLRPAGVVRSGNLLFVADADAHRVWQADLATGAVTAFAGTGTQGLAGDGGPAAQARLASPRELALDGSGNLYVADWGNNRVRVVNRQATTQTLLNVSVAPGDIATVAGGGEAATGARPRRRTSRTRPGSRSTRAAISSSPMPVRRGSGGSPRRRDSSPPSSGAPGEASPTARRRRRPG